MLKKQCDCKGTSSGPRYVNQTEEREGKIVWVTKYHRMVCDVCDKPWLREPKPEPVHDS